ncbi:unnamed protein product [Paramecium sonneborni]|uniref:Transmembrane protein n=1 Tax=Paramecium sonneborni TaxID=65129 RepID=A0A8S1RL24_9CILI|nr:unnamed protein product [Paramecium sonneborni]
MMYLINQYYIKHFQDVEIINQKLIMYVLINVEMESYQNNIKNVMMETMQEEMNVLLIVQLKILINVLIQKDVQVYVHLLLLLTLYQMLFIEFTFNQQVKLSQEINFEQIVIYTITPQTQYKLTINCLSNLTTTLNNPNYQIVIEFIEPILNLILQIDIDKSLIQNEFQLNLFYNQKQVNLATSIVLPQTTKQKLTSIVQLNDIMMYSMATVSSLAFLTGNAIMFFNLLDLLQSLSYIRFMQCQFLPF